MQTFYSYNASTFHDHYGSNAIDLHLNGIHASEEKAEVMLEVKI